MAPSKGKATGKKGTTPPVAGNAAVAVQEPPTTETPQAAEEVRAPVGGLAIAKGNGEVKTLKVCRSCGVELPEDFEHDHCEDCHRHYLEDLAARQGKVLCTTPKCTTFVYPRLDKRDPYCLTCRLVYAEQRAKGNPDAEAAIAKAVAAFKRGDKREAVENLKETNRILAKVRAERVMASFNPANASSEAQVLYDEALEHFEAGRYRQAEDSVYAAKRTAQRETALERSRLAEVARQEERRTFAGQGSQFRGRRADRDRENRDRNAGWQNRVLPRQGRRGCEEHEEHEEHEGD